MSVSLILVPLSSPSTHAVPRVWLYNPVRPNQRQFAISSFKVRGFNGKSENSASVATKKRGWEEWLAGAASLYPMYVTVGGVIAFVKPSTFSWFVSLAPTSYSFTLGFIMLAMGITLEFKELVNLFRQRPLSILFGCLSQYTIMPALGTIISKLLGLSPSLSVGLILLSCCPGGTASNVVTLVAQGDVPLSIVMTVCSTLGAVILTPLLSNILAGAYVPINVVELSISTLQVVVAPVLLGSYLQSKFPRLVKWLTPFAPLTAVLSSSLLASSVFSQNVYRLKSTPSLLSNASSSTFGIQQLLSTEMCTVVASVLLLHLSGFCVGYACAAIAGFKERQRRAISIEVGMQNSSLGVVLATCHFSSPMVVVPAAMSAVLMNVAGSTLGLVWKHIQIYPCED